jgi:hypothetical protein
MSQTTVKAVELSDRELERVAGGKRKEDTMTTATGSRDRRR